MRLQFHRIPFLLGGPAHAEDAAAAGVGCSSRNEVDPARAGCDTAVFSGRCAGELPHSESAGYGAATSRPFPALAPARSARSAPLDSQLDFRLASGIVAGTFRANDGKGGTMRGLLMVCLLVSGSGCRAIVDRQGLLGAAREARDWAASVAAAPENTAAPAEDTGQGPSAPLARAGEPVLAPPYEDRDPPSNAARTARPVSVTQSPPAADEGEAEARGPVRSFDETVDESPQPSGPLEALRALLLQPPRVGTAPVPQPAYPTSVHPTPARSTWRRLNRGEDPSFDEPRAPATRASAGRGR